MKNRLPAFIATALLLLFLAPYIWKIKAVPLIILLVFGVVLVVFDFIQSNKEKPKFQAQQAPYEEEST
jgi:hypothetical protein